MAYDVFYSKAVSSRRWLYAPQKMGVMVGPSSRQARRRMGLIGNRISGPGPNFRRLPGALAAARQTGANERGEKRVRRERLRFELRMELAADEPGMVGNFDDLDVNAVGRAPRDAEARARQRLIVFAVEFVAVPVPLGNLERAVSLRRKRPRLEFAGPRAQPHRPAHFVDAEQFAQLVNHAIGSGGVEFRAVGAFQFSHLPRVLDRRALHTQANAEERNSLLARVGDRVNHSLDSALSEAARHEDAVHVPQQSLRRRG